MMDTSDVLAVVAATVVAILAGVLIATLYSLTRTLQTLRTTVERLREETVALLDDAHDAIRDATTEVDRIDRLVGSAEKINDAVDGAQRMAYKTLGVTGREGDGVRQRRLARRAAHTRRRAARADSCSVEGPEAEAGALDVQAALLAPRRFRARAGILLGDRAEAAPGRGALRADRSRGPLGRHDASRRRRRSGRDAVPRSGAEGNSGARGRAVTCIRWFPARRVSRRASRRSCATNCARRSSTSSSRAATRRFRPRA